MTFQQLQYLLEVRRTGSVTQAAKNLFVSSSSVSISVGNLEKELGYSLFIRTQKGLVPTERGRKVLEYAERICRTYRQLNAIDQDTKRCVRINAGSHSFVSRAFAKLLEETHNRDGVQLTLTSYDGDELYQKMIHNELDLSLLMIRQYVFGSWEKRLKKGGLDYKLIRTIPVAVQVGPQHRLADRKIISPPDLRDEILVDNPHSPNSGSSIFSSTVYTDPEKVIFAAGNNTRTMIVNRGIGYSICAMPPAEVLKTATSRYIPLDGVNYYLLAVTNPQFPTPPEATRFLELLETALEEDFPHD